MEWNYILLWIVGTTTVGGAIRGFRASPRPKNVLYLFAAIASVTAICWAWYPDIAGFVGGGLLVAFLLVPGLLAIKVLQLATEQKFDAAARLSRVVRCLHPFGVMRWQPQYLDAVGLAERGETDKACRLLEKMETGPVRLARLAKLQLFRIRQQWPELLQWIDANFDDQALRRDPSPFLMAVRALGETGQVERMLEIQDPERAAFKSSVYLRVRKAGSLYTNVFAGRPDRVEALFRGALRRVPGALQQYWVGTAELAAGRKAEGEARLHRSLSSASPIVKVRIEQRLRQPPSPVTLSLRAQEILARLDQEQAQSDRVAAIRPPGWRPRVTYALVLANVAMFVVECIDGGSTNLDTLVRLGAFITMPFEVGQYWRLLTANFLHFGTAHLAMNMVALLYLGPFVELGLGSISFLVLYLLSGVGAMASVWALQMWQIVDPGLLVGASGAIMALVGATISILFRGLLRENARIVRRRLAYMLLLVGMQVIFDYVTPHVSGAAHLSGLIIGFVLASVMPHRKPAAGAVPMKGSSK